MPAGVHRDVAPDVTQKASKKSSETNDAGIFDDAAILHDVSSVDDANESVDSTSEIGADVPLYDNDGGQVVDDFDGSSQDAAMEAEDGGPSHLLDGGNESPPLPEAMLSLNEACAQGLIPAARLDDGQENRRVPHTSVGCSELTVPDHVGGTERMYRFLNAGDLQIAERMLENCWTLPRFDEICFPGEVPTWNEDPYDENYWRFVFYSLRPLRHLLYAWTQTHDERYRIKLIDLIRSFADAAQESPWIYTHHADKHGAAFRALVLTLIRWQLQQDFALATEEIEFIDALVSDTAAYLLLPENFQSHYNHGFNQAAGLLAISTNFPHLPNSLQWDRVARERVDHMMTNVVDEDGVMIESTPYYHSYIILLMGDIVLWGNENQIPLPPVIADRFPKMMSYLTDVSYPDGNLPLIGAGIPGNTLHVGAYDVWESSYPRLAWIRSGGTRGGPQVDSPLDFHTSYYPLSGHVTLRSSWFPAFVDISHVVFDAGPYRTDHSDFDHFNLTWFQGRPILVDPGLFSYESGPVRDYFHGTSAHNVVVVDGLEQPEHYDMLPVVIEKGSDWGAATSTVWQNETEWMRTIVAFGEQSLLVIDDVRAATQRSFSQLWHLAPDLFIDLAGSSNATGLVRTENGTPWVHVEWTSPQAQVASVIRGQESPLQGWVNDGYEMKSPADVLTLRSEDNHLQLATLWSLGETPSAWSVTFSDEQIDFQMGADESFALSIDRQADGSWLILP